MCCVRFQPWLWIGFDYFRSHRKNYVLGCRKDRRGRLGAIVMTTKMPYLYPECEATEYSVMSLLLRRTAGLVGHERFWRYLFPGNYCIVIFVDN